MTEQPDFLKQAIEALRDGEQAHSDASTEFHAPEYYEELSAHLMKVAQTMALLSLAQDVRRVADTLKEIEGALVDASGCYR